MQKENQPVKITERAERAIQNLSTTTASTTSSEPPLGARIEKIFLSLGFILNSKFTGLFPTDKARLMAKRIWQQQLANFSDKEIETGINNAANWNGDFFNLPEFKKLCRPEKTIIPPYYDKAQKSLPSNFKRATVDGPAYAAATQEMRQIVAKRGIKLKVGPHTTI